MNQLIKRVFRNLAILCFCIVCCLPIGKASTLLQLQEIALLDAIDILSRKYHVYFTYDRTLVNNIKVKYESEDSTSVEEELDFLLRSTELKFQVFKNQFVILYKEGEEGLSIFQQMSSKMTEPVESRNTEFGKGSIVQRLSMLAELSNDWMEYVNFETSVHGLVFDEDQIPLIGVNVRVKGKDIGTATDFNGYYELPNVNENDVLEFSYIGYISHEETVNGRKEVNVVLKTDAQTLDEVIVVGYGSQKKVNVSGAVDYIDAKEIQERPVANVMQGLQGMSPGLNINYAGGQPGAKPTINIRGFTSINGGDPLLIIDGVASAYDDLLRINPNDIESFSVLKDAASAAIYGARAAFGVILLTTKSGKDGKNTISYNSFVAWGKPTVLPKPITDPYIFSRVKETSTDNTPWDYVNYSDEHFRWAKERSDDPSIEDIRLDPSDPTKWAYMGDNNWYDYFLHNSSVSQNHNLSFSGGLRTESGKSINYYLSGDWSTENGLNKLADDYYNRYGIRGKLDFTPLPWLNLNNNASLYQTEHINPLTNIVELYDLYPTDVVKNPDGTWANTDAGKFAARLIDGGNNTNEVFGFQNITGIKASFFDDALVLNSRLSIKKELWSYNAIGTKYQIGYGPDDVRTEGGNGYVSETSGTLHNTIVDLYGSYTKTMGNHTFSVLAGANQEDYTYSYIYGYRDNLISSTLPYLALTSGDPKINAYYSSYATQSLFGRLNYNLLDKYMLEVNGRYDGSSRFPENSRWGFFPSVSAAWVVSQEDFVSSWLTDRHHLKLRLSYGDLGNQAVGNFNYIQTLSTGTSPYLVDGKQSIVITGGAPSLQIDPYNYTWERVTTLNFGLDAGFFDGKLQAVFDIYNRKTIGMLTAGQELPAVLGTSVPKQNTADLETKGWEVALTYRDALEVANKPLDYGFKFILSDSRSWITKFKNDLNSFSNWREGQEVGEIWGLVNDGLFKTEAEIEQLDESDIVPWGALSIVPGWPKYVDQDGNGKIERGTSTDDLKDYKKIGNTSSRYRIGTEMNLSWNNIDFSLFLQGVLKRDYYPRRFLYWGPYQQPYGNVYPWNLDYYRGSADSENLRSQHSQSYIDAGLADANTDASFPIIQSWLADNNYGTGLDISQTGYMQNGAYLRVKNLSVGYTLPQEWTDQLKIARFKLYITGENIYEFSPIKYFLDPEAVEILAGNIYPIQRKISIGLNINF